MTQNRLAVMFSFYMADAGGSKVSDHGYDTDFVLWAENQALDLRAAALTDTTLPIDWENVADEIEGVAVCQKRETRRRLSRVCPLLLQWHHQTERQTSSWRSTIVEQRRQLDDRFEDSPSLRDFALIVLPESFKGGSQDAEMETGLLHFPTQCPWTFGQISDQNFWPN
jgi:hypothetical protein